MPYGGIDAADFTDEASLVDATDLICRDARVPAKVVGRPTTDEPSIRAWRWITVFDNAVDKGNEFRFFRQNAQSVETPLSRGSGLRQSMRDLCPGIGSERSCSIPRYCLPLKLSQPRRIPCGESPVV